MSGSPDWTGGNESDPGVTLPALLAFLALLATFLLALGVARRQRRRRGGARFDRPDR